MSRQTIGWLYVLNLLLGIISLPIFFPNQSDLAHWSNQIALDQNKYDTDELEFNTLNSYNILNNWDNDPIQINDSDAITQDQRHIEDAQSGIALAIIFMIISGICGMIAWISTLVKLSNAQLWAWFILTFLFGGLMILIYLIANPQPLVTRVVAQTSPPLPQPASQTSSPSALEILRQRFARGEIDTATFQQMLELLEKSTESGQ